MYALEKGCTAKAISSITTVAVQYVTNEQLPALLPDTSNVTEAGFGRGRPQQLVALYRFFNETQDSVPDAAEPRTLMVLTLQMHSSCKKGQGVSINPSARQHPYDFALN